MNPLNIYKSIFLEISALTIVLFERSLVSVIAFFLLHGLASFLISQIILTLMPSSYRKKYSLNLFFMTLFNTSTLFLGYAASFYLVLVMLRRQKNYEKYEIDSLNFSQLMLFPKIKRQLGEGAASVNPLSLPKETKLKIISAFSSEIKPEAVKVIKSFLSDEDNEIRLYSFQMLNKIKNDINSKINLALSELEKETVPFKKALLQKKLALYYSNMFNLEISEESLKNFFMEKSMSYLSQAESFMGDGDLLFLKGQILFAKQEYDNALETLAKSIKYGMDTQAVYPLMAEIYFIKGDYKMVRETLKKDFSLKLDFHTMPISVIWEG